ncbi:MAG TPA: TlpA disulfide reductase family protein [Terriglobia bacterium]|nr:TlpA disulfide reductase family protein [Terriglobia bacterium]
MSRAGRLRSLGWRSNAAAAIAACLMLAIAPAGPGGAARAQAGDAEARVLGYIKDHLQPGQPVLISELYGKVFTQPAERQVLDKLYNAFFRIPLFLAEYQEKFGSPPTLKTVAQQFDLKTPDAADTLLRVMESDPRVPRFFVRDAHTGEITQVYVGIIRGDPRFAQAVSVHLSGWEGKPAPAFKLSGLDGHDLDSAELRNKVVLLYVWFTGCPPCMKETPAIVKLEHEIASPALVVVGANADQELGLGYDDQVRRRYVREQSIDYAIVNWSKESDAAFGRIAVFPTLFLIDRTGTIAGHWVGYTEPADLRSAIRRALGK